MQPAILWFRRNLRLRDNAALIAAAESGQPIIPVYISNAQDAGGASRWWLHHSLAALDSSLRSMGSSLTVMSGEPDAALAELVEQTGATGIYFARRYEPHSIRDEEAIEASFADKIDVCGFGDSLLNDPDTVLTQGQTPFRVYTPYWRAACRLGEPAPPQSAPRQIRFAKHSVPSLDLDALKLLPSTPDWAGGLRADWQPGEAGALQRCDDIADAALNYAEHRDRPDLDSTSRLSAHLHFGEVSIREAWHAIRGAEARNRSSRGAEALLRQLYWRDFSAYLLYHFPQLPHTPLRPEFEHFPWLDDATLLRAWQQGRTGFPIVDAGMRQLWQTGWMHNRVRMIAASFLIKDLMIPWQRGADWFLDTLVDADLANNSASWQWVAGCGTDAAPYFRIFNPTLQGKKFDPDGRYVRRWVPELAQLPAKLVHEPWNATQDAQETFACMINRDYPEPIVDHAAARARALEAYRITRSAR
jgi:deoxyribodipyrimidine photo-lyase